MTQSNNSLQVGASGATTSRGSDQKFCFSCGCVLHASAVDCPKCGARQPDASVVTAIVEPPALPPNLQQLKPNHVFCRGCSAVLHETAQACPKCGAPQLGSQGAMAGGGRTKMAAALFAFFLGWAGGHKFYLGQTGMGILYLLFFWTAIPGFIAFIEGIIYLTMSDAEFARKYS